MADIPMKTKQPTEAHIALLDELKAGLARAVKAHPSLQAQDMLAVISHLAGSVLALLDQRRFTPDMGITIVSTNLESGNSDAIDGLFEEGGSA